MQNKRINSEISSVEANIQNFEDTKKVHVSKKQFKEAQIANNEIKKCMENKNQLNELLKGNDVEIETLNNDNKETNENINNYNKEIKTYEKEIKEDNNKYMKNLLNILNQFFEDIDNDDPDKNMVKEIINSISVEIYPNGIPEENEKGLEEVKEEIKEEVKEEDSGNKEENKLDEMKKEEIVEEKTLEGIQNEIKDLEKKLDELIKEEKFDECEITNNKIEELKRKIEKKEYNEQ